MPKWKMEPPEFARRGGATERPRSLQSEERGAEGPSGPSGPPRPGEKAPHEDVGEFLNDLVGHFQEAGQTIAEALDKPFTGTVGIKGPHRLIDAGLSTGTGLLRSVITHSTRIK